MSEIECKRCGNNIIIDFVEPLPSLRARIATLEAALRVIYTAVRGDEKAQHHDARAWLDERGIFNGDLDGSFASGDAVVAEVCRAALAPPSPSSAAKKEEP